MHLKQLAFAGLCCLGMIAPAMLPVPAQAQTAPKPAAPAAAAPATPATAPAPAAKPAHAAPVITTPINLNTASATELRKLPQVGKHRSAAIIKGRPYKATDDLVTKKILPAGVFDKIKDKVTI